MKYNAYFAYKILKRNRSFSHGHERNFPFVFCSENLVNVTNVTLDIHSIFGTHSKYTQHKSDFIVGKKKDEKNDYIQRGKYGLA